MSTPKKSVTLKVCRCCGKELPEDIKGAFCSERCRLNDLSMWFNEDYKIASEAGNKDLSADNYDDNE
jgi:endogenous inhibitor of DNA gyrase (YacG/DUF329 family)